MKMENLVMNEVITMAIQLLSEDLLRDSYKQDGRLTIEDGTGYADFINTNNNYQYELKESDIWTKVQSLGHSDYNKFHQEFNKMFPEDQITERGDSLSYFSIEVRPEIESDEVRFIFTLDLTAYLEEVYYAEDIHLTFYTTGSEDNVSSDYILNSDGEEVDEYGNLVDDDREVTNPDELTTAESNYFRY